MDAEDGETHAPAAAAGVRAGDAAVGGCGDDGVFDNGNRLGRSAGLGHVEQEVTLAVALHLQVRFGRGIALHESVCLVEQGQVRSFLTVEIEAIFLAAHLEEIAVEASGEVGRVGHQVEACVVVGRRVERQVHVHLPARAVGGGERGRQVGRALLFAVVVEADGAVGFKAEFFCFALPFEPVVGVSVVGGVRRVTFFGWRLAGLAAGFFHEDGLAASGKRQGGREQGDECMLFLHGRCGVWLVAKIGNRLSVCVLFGGKFMKAKTLAVYWLTWRNELLLQKLRNL